MYLAKVYVTLKPGVNDPQGLAVLGGLHQMDYQNVEQVRIGKYLELQVRSDDGKFVEAEIQGMCQRLLANPVIEDFRFEVEIV